MRKYLDYIAVGVVCLCLVSLSGAGSLFTDVTSHYPPDIARQVNAALDALEDSIDGTTPMAGKFTTLEASGATTLATTLNGAVQATAGVISAGTLGVAVGGTGAATLTDHGVLVGSGTGAITPLTVGGANEALMGAAGADPVFRALVDADIPDTHTHAAASIGRTSLAADGQGAIVAAAASVTESWGMTHKTVISLTNVVLIVADGGDRGASEKVYDFPEGAVNVLGVVVDASVESSATFNATATDKFKVAIGTVAAAQDADLTSTEADLAPAVEIATDDGGGANTRLTNDFHSHLATAAIFDGTATAKDVFVNLAIADTSMAANTTNTITGTITIHWMNLGDY